ncbi:MAG: ATP-binding protein [Eubacteriales bacterium]
MNEGSRRLIGENELAACGCNLRRKLCLSHFPAGGFHRAPLSLHRLHHEGKIRGLFVAHLNHGIRGEAAARDQRWCMAPANDWRFRLRQKPDVPSHAKANASLEQAARALRYDFLERARLSFDASVIATAHHWTIRRRRS